MAIYLQKNHFSGKLGTKIDLSVKSTMALFKWRQPLALLVAAADGM